MKLVLKNPLTIALALFNVSGTVDSLLFMVYHYSCNLWVILLDHEIKKSTNAFHRI